MSHVEIKYYSAAYFEHIATFEVLYRQTSARSRSHTHLLDEAVSAVSLRGAMSPSLLWKFSEYSTLSAAMWLKYA